jgi:CubicO group peptidase (beta-lactamase class C family)
MTVREALEAHELPGAVALVARGGDVEVTVVGEAARDSLFRIASIGKPITAAAVMLLVESGAVGLDDPVARWFPELASPVVVRTPDAPVDDVVPASREVTVRDVLEFRAGWGFPSDFSLPAVQLLFQEAFPMGRAFASSDEWVAGLAKVPLLHQPGEGWLYNACSDLQGVLVERASGRPFPEFLAERIFGPLGMSDTAFFVPPDKHERLLPYFAADLSPADPSVDRYLEPPGFASGAGGLVSTADDMLAFARLLLARGGELLSDESFELMTSDHLTEKQREEAWLFLEGQGWGYGGAVDRETGRYGWIGGSGTTFHVVPATRTTSILLTQVQMTGPTPQPVMRDFWCAAGVG